MRFVLKAVVTTVLLPLNTQVIDKTTELQEILPTVNSEGIIIVNTVPTGWIFIGT